MLNLWNWHHSHLLCINKLERTNFLKKLFSDEKWTVISIFWIILRPNNSYALLCWEVTSALQHIHVSFTSKIHDTSIAQREPSMGL